MNLDRPDRPRVHVDVPDLERQIIPREHVSPVVAELDVRYGGDNFREERSVRGVFLFFEFCQNEQFSQKCVLGGLGEDARLACRSQRAESRMSANLMVPLELEYMNRLQCMGWNSAAVMTSVSSSIFTGLMSTISAKSQNPNVKFPAFARQINKEHVLKLSLDIARFQRLTLKSSAEM